jgi:hypothetical protein
MQSVVKIPSYWMLKFVIYTGRDHGIYVELIIL